VTQRGGRIEIGPSVVTILMKPGVVSVESSATVLEVARLMKHEGVRNVFVTKAGKPVGLVRDIDIIDKVVASRLDPETVRAERIMLPPPAVGRDAGLEEITRLMASTGARRILVVDNDKPLGTITAGDLLNFIERNRVDVEPLLKKLETG